jgi:hypothetical protein
MLEGTIAIADDLLEPDLGGAGEDAKGLGHTPDSHF